MADLKVDHLPFVGAGEFDTSYAPVEFDDGQYHVKCVVNYGSFYVNEEYREGGIMWSVTDTETDDEIRLVAQEGDARVILFAESTRRAEQASTEYSLADTAYAHVAKGTLFRQLTREIARNDEMNADKWKPLLQAAFRNINMEATLQGLGYNMS